MIGKSVSQLGPWSLLAASVLLLLGTEAQARKANARLEVDTKVIGAKVHINGRAVGRTPLSEPLYLAPGRVRLKLTKRGYKDFAKRVKVSANKTSKVRAKMVPTGAILRVIAPTDEATITVDGARKGRGSIEIAMKPGRRVVVVANFGGQPHTERVVLKNGTIQTVRVEAPEDTNDDPLALTLVPLSDDGDAGGIGLQLAEVPMEPDQEEPPLKLEAPPARKEWYEGLHKEWWVWAAGGAVIIGGVTTAIVLSGDDGPAPVSFDCTVAPGVAGGRQGC